MQGVRVEDLARHLVKNWSSPLLSGSLFPSYAHPEFLPLPLATASCHCVSATTEESSPRLRRRRANEGFILPLSLRFRCSGEQTRHGVIPSTVKRWRKRLAPAGAAKKFFAQRRISNSAEVRNFLGARAPLSLLHSPRSRERCTRGRWCNAVRETTKWSKRCSLWQKGVPSAEVLSLSLCLL